MDRYQNSQQALDLLTLPPDTSITSILMIEAMLFLSMGSGPGGKYLQSSPNPSQTMIYGLLENALGWHFPGGQGSPREKIAHSMKQQKHLPALHKSPVGYVSLLQHHVCIESVSEPPTERFADYATEMVMSGTPSLGSSTTYDAQLRPIIDRVRKKLLSIDDNSASYRGDSETLAHPENIPPGIVLHWNVVKDYMGDWYRTQRKREWVEPIAAYSVVLKTGPEMAQHLCYAVEHPAAPLYMGNSEGWVEATWINP